ncbi:hypothetical protein [Sodalis-like endosymbiont of Proechinophthirus fluctus]|nr:hypothetical protein [Sodalis-like endosymbiont of Proechinophthirus fluctus]
MPVLYLSYLISLTDIAGKLVRVNDTASWDIRIIPGSQCPGR